MAVTTPAQLLLAIAEHEQLEATCAALDVPLDRARALLKGAARALQEKEPAPPAPRAPQRMQRPTAAELERAADALLAGDAGSAVGTLRAAPKVAPIAPPAASAGPAALPARVRVYSDGASRGNPGPAGAGAVITTASGAVLRRLGRFLGRATNNVAEYEGLLLGLRAALAEGAREVDVRADSELLIRQLQGVYRVKNQALQGLYTEAKALLGRFSKVTLEHVPRADNAQADEMSNRAIDEKM